MQKVLCTIIKRKHLPQTMPWQPLGNERPSVNKRAKRYNQSSDQPMCEINLSDVPQSLPSLGRPPTVMHNRPRLEGPPRPAGSVPAARRALRANKAPAIAAFAWPSAGV